MYCTLSYTLFTKDKFTKYNTMPNPTKHRAKIARRLFSQFYHSAAISCAEFARRLELSESIVRKYLNGTRNITRNTVRALREAFPDAPIADQLTATLRGELTE
jgi:predicted transcriptional regulator